MDNELTEIIFLLDRSGSMSGLEHDTIGGFNGFIKSQQKLPGKAIATVVLFDDRSEILWRGKNIDKIHLSEKEYYVRGTTALLDAIGKTIINVHHRFEIIDEDLRPSKVFFVITTDGYENASTEFSHNQIKSLIEKQKEKNNWQFLFLGANIDEVSEAAKIGIDSSDTVSFSSTGMGVKDMYDTVYEVISSFRLNGKK